MGESSKDNLITRRNFLRASGIASILAFPFLPNSLYATVKKSSFTKVKNSYAVNQPSILLGVDVLEGMLFSPLAKKRVGLLTNPAGVNRHGISTIDVLRSSKRVRLVALFGPEHGIYGNEKADVPVEGGIDKRTGLPVFSLYGKYRKPTAKMLEGIDVLVVDLQDIGSRSYTFVSCMIRAMEACFEYGKEVVVLDRPNPLGGLKTDGPWLDNKYKSYVGMLTVPYVHAMTIGELARFAKNTDGALEITTSQRRNGRLTIVPMRGWKRSMMWSDTRLPWIPPSPAITSTSAAAGYAMTGLGCQLGGFKHGYGSNYPFRMLSYSGLSNESLAQLLRRCGIEGLSFTPVSAQTSKSSTGGVYVGISDWRSLAPTAISFHLMRLSCLLSKGNPFASATKAKADLFNKHTGCGLWWREISAKGSKADVARYLELFRIYSNNFKDKSRQFYLYS